MLQAIEAFEKGLEFYFLILYLNEEILNLKTCIIKAE